MATGMTTTGLASQYAEIVKQVNKDAQGVSDWERRFLKPLEEKYQTYSETISQQTGYDISSAYANYKKAQLNALQNQQLTSGFKEQLSTDLQTAYESAYQQAKTTELSNLTELREQYEKELATENTRLLGVGTNLAKLENAIWDYAGVTNAKEEGYYTTNDGSNYTLTAKGVDAFDKYLNDRDFTTLLQQENPDLYDFLLEHKGLVNQALAGLTPTDIDYDELEHYDALVKDEQKRNPLISDIATVDDKGNIKIKNATYKKVSDNKLILLSHTTLGDKPISDFNGLKEGDIIEENGVKLRFTGYTEGKNNYPEFDILVPEGSTVKEELFKIGKSSLYELYRRSSLKNIGLGVN